MEKRNDSFFSQQALSQLFFLIYIANSVTALLDTES